MILNVKDLSIQVGIILANLQQDQRPTALTEAQDAIVRMMTDDRQAVRQHIKNRALATLPEPIDIHQKYEGQQFGDMSRYELNIEENPEDLQMMLRITEDIGFSNAADAARQAVERL